ncbi:AAA family ATPase [Zoogloea sp. LCSB751]|uniref:AAA family ATPase n=1 Tax=Zoogloea sp. LCSB751 TaxID=1965277 RepID=UPI0013748472|nr:AAA family ATPase [Zoogloea sp. LCSB751]
MAVKPQPTHRIWQSQLTDYKKGFSYLHRLSGPFRRGTFDNRNLQHLNLKNMENSLLSQPAPIFNKFTLNGLHGYKNVSLSCHSPIKIVSADNGSGKTSLLNAIYAVFEGRPTLLYSLDFESIEIVWSDDSISSYQKDELFSAFKPDDLDSIAESDIFSIWDIEKDSAIDLLTKYILGDLDEASQTRAFKDIYRGSPYDKDEIFEQLSSLCAPFLKSRRFSDLYAKAKAQLNGCSVLYLPTYRRIEADIPEFRSTPQQPNRLTNRGRAAKDAWSSTRLIFFGMGDIEARLNSIFSQIRKETLEASTRSNGQTLEQLIGADPDTDVTLQETFDLASIEAVLARVGKNTSELRAGLSALIESREIYKENRGELRRFLSQLLKVYAQRREDEEAIEQFTNIVNRYIYPEGDDPNSPIKSEKRLMFDKVKLELEVRNTIIDKEIKFENLSSGEKQVISIFARLMLDPRKNYLILVDEPELSLSLEWQQMLLPDISSSPNFRQLVAITHSPFIFDNNLALAAGSLETTYKNGAETQQ